MGRLIDADKLIAKIEEIYDGYMLSEDGGVVPKDFVEFLEEAPTVEAIPKDNVNKAILEIIKYNHEGFINISLARLGEILQKCGVSEDAKNT